MERNTLAQNSRIIHSQFFEQELIKLQSGLADTMSIKERNAVHALLEPENNNTSSQVDDSFNRIAERLAKRRRIGDPSKDYIDCSFILGSSAEVERVFSMGRMF